MAAAEDVEAVKREVQAMLSSAKALAMTAVDLLMDPDARLRIAAEFSGASGAR